MNWTWFMFFCWLKETLSRSKGQKLDQTCTVFIRWRESDKSTPNSGKITPFLFFFFQNSLFWGIHKTFVLCSLGDRRHLAEIRLGAHPPTDIMDCHPNWHYEILPFRLWLYLNADRIISNIVQQQKKKKKGKENKRKELCSPRRSWQICKGGKFTFKLVSGSHKQKWTSRIGKSIASCMKT